MDCGHTIENCHMDSCDCGAIENEHVEGHVVDPGFFSSYTTMPEGHVVDPGFAHYLPPVGMFGGPVDRSKYADELPIENDGVWKTSDDTLPTVCWNHVARDTQQAPPVVTPPAVDPLPVPMNFIPLVTADVNTGGADGTIEPMVNERDVIRDHMETLDMDEGVGSELVVDEHLIGACVSTEDEIARAETVRAILTHKAEAVVRKMRRLEAIANAGPVIASAVPHKGDQGFYYFHIMFDFEQEGVQVVRSRGYTKVSDLWIHLMSPQATLKECLGDCLSVSGQLYYVPNTRGPPFTWDLSLPFVLTRERIRERIVIGYLDQPERIVMFNNADIHGLTQHEFDLERQVVRELTHKRVTDYVDSVYKELNLVEECTRDVLDLVLFGESDELDNDSGCGDSGCD